MQVVKVAFMEDVGEEGKSQRQEEIDALKKKVAKLARENLA